MYGSEWSSVSRLAAGSYFCGSPEPEPITWWVWWLVRITIRSILAVSPTCGRRRRARSISACAWYSAECSLV